MAFAFEVCFPAAHRRTFLPSSISMCPMDFTEVQKAGSRMGTGTMIVLDDQTCPVGMVWNLEHFFAQESCGWCTPCWSGLRWWNAFWAMEEGRGEAGRSREACSSRRNFWRRAIPFALLRPAPPNRSRAPLNTFATISSGTSAKSGVPGDEDGDDLHRQSSRTRSNANRTFCTPVFRWASTCRTSAGIRRWARWARAANAR